MLFWLIIFKGWYFGWFVSLLGILSMNLLVGIDMLIGLFGVFLRVDLMIFLFEDLVDGVLFLLSVGSLMFGGFLVLEVVLFWFLCNVLSWCLKGIGGLEYFVMVCFWIVKVFVVSGIFVFFEIWDWGGLCFFLDLFVGGVVFVCLVDLLLFCWFVCGIIGVDGFVCSLFWLFWFGDGVIEVFFGS